MPIDNELQIAVVDDIDQDRVQIMEETDTILNHGKIKHSIDCYADAETLLGAIRGGKKYNLLLLDVLMDDMDGMALAQELREQGNQTAIIFISISQEMARRGYRVNASRYLVKPLDRKELEEALIYCYSQWLNKKKILVPIDQGELSVSFMDVQYVEAYDRGTRFCLTNEIIETKLKFKETEAILPKSVFIMCHRAYMVNQALIKGISQYEFRMKSGAVVPISRYRYNDVHQAFLDFITD